MSKKKAGKGIAEKLLDKGLKLVDGIETEGLALYEAAKKQVPEIVKEIPREGISDCIISLGEALLHLIITGIYAGGGIWCVNYVFKNQGNMVKLESVILMGIIAIGCGCGVLYGSFNVCEQMGWRVKQLVRIIIAPRLYIINRLKEFVKK